MKSRFGYKKTSDGALEHRRVNTFHSGAIPRGWVVHHVNGEKLDNRSENLVALPRACHRDLHAHYEKNLPDLVATKQYLIDWLRSKEKPKKYIPAKPGEGIWIKKRGKQMYVRPS